jgi:hypothetical protein
LAKQQVNEQKEGAMANEKNSSQFISEDYEPPTWLKCSLRAARDLAAFESQEVPPLGEENEQKIRTATEAVTTLLEWRRAKQRINFQPLAIADYVKGLEEATGRPARPVLRCLGIADLSFPEPATAGAMARLALHLGFGFREALAHVRIAFANLSGHAPMPMLIALRRPQGAQRNALEECETVLGEIEEDLDQESRGRLRQIESEIRAVYAAYEHNP